jgi:hypothetical protein
MDRIRSQSISLIRPPLCKRRVQLTRSSGSRRRAPDSNKPSTSDDLGDDVDLAVGRDRFELGVLKDLAVDRDRDAVLEMRLEGRVALTEGAQQLADILGVELELAPAARVLRQPSGE